MLSVAHLLALAASAALCSASDAESLRGAGALSALAPESHHHHHHHGDDEDTICHRWDWRKKALKLITEMPASGLFKDLHGHTKFEVSGLTEHNGAFVMVFDSLMELGFTDPRLGFMGANNYLAGKREGESEYEAVVTRTKTNTLLAVKEGHLSPVDKEWHAIVYDLTVNDDKTITINSECKMEFILPDGDKKGIEGAEYIDNGDKGEFLLGLCEGNFCEGNKKRGREKGNGRIVLSKLDDSEPGCVWKYERMIEVPKSANFNDFSDIDIEGQGTNARVIISSQEDAAVWIGRINTETFEFQDVGAVLHFPRMGSDCEAQYCNIEGVAFIDDARIMTTTDRAKEDQPWGCSAKDQSVQVFALPHSKEIP